MSHVLRFYEIFNLLRSPQKSMNVAESNDSISRKTKDLHPLKRSGEAAKAKSGPMELGRLLEDQAAAEAREATFGTHGEVDFQLVGRILFYSFIFFWDFTPSLENKLNFCLVLIVLKNGEMWGALF